MWRASLRDLQWRRRRFLIAIFATGLVFAMTLLMSGTSNALHEQDRRIIDSFDGDAWFVAEGASGPFTTTTPIPVDAAEQIADLEGVTRAAPVFLPRGTLQAEETRDVNIVAVPPDGLGAPDVDDGRWIEAAGETVVDTALGIDVGSTVNVGGLEVRVVGTADDVTYFFGTPTVFITLEDAQDQILAGLPLAGAVVAQGAPTETPPGLKMMSVDDVREDIKRPTKSGDETITFINVMLWVVAAGIIGSIVYLSSLERSRDFAVMKATGASTSSLLVGLAIQAVILSLASAIVAAVLAQLLAPGFPFAISIKGSTYAVLVAVAVLIGLLASGAGLRRAVRVDPALAFGGA